MEIVAVAVIIAVVMVLRLNRRRAQKRLGEEIARTIPAARTAKSSRTFARPSPVPNVLEGSAYVVDGDTIVINKTHIRLFGIDAAELDHPYGKNAKWALISLCKGNKVRAEITEQDVHGRAVAKCHLPDGRDLSAEMVKLGLAIDWPKFSGGRYRSLEPSDARKKLWLAVARQKGQMTVWERFEPKEARRASHGR